MWSGVDELALYREISMEVGCAVQSVTRTRSPRIFSSLAPLDLTPVTMTHVHLPWKVESFLCVRE